MPESSKKMTFKVNAQRDNAHGSSAYCKDAKLIIDTDLQGRVDAFNPAELLITAISTSENTFSVHVVKHEDRLNDGSLLEDITSAIQYKFNVSHVTIQIESKPYSNTCKSIYCTEN